MKRSYSTKFKLEAVSPKDEIEFTEEGIKFVIINLSGKDKEIEIKIKEKGK